MGLAVLGWVGGCSLSGRWPGVAGVVEASGAQPKGVPISSLQAMQWCPPASAGSVMASLGSLPSVVEAGWIPPQAHASIATRANSPTEAGSLWSWSAGSRVLANRASRARLAANRCVREEGTIAGPRQASGGAVQRQGLCRLGWGLSARPTNSWNLRGFSGTNAMLLTCRAPPGCRQIPRQTSKCK